jgi:hypothetical protein
VQVQTYAQIHHAHALSIHVQREQRRNTGQLGHITVDNREVSITIVRIHRVLTQSVAIRGDELDRSDNSALSWLELAGVEPRWTTELARIADHNTRAAARTIDRHGFEDALSFA